MLASLFAEYDFDLLRRDDDPDPTDQLTAFAFEDRAEWLLTLAAIARVTDDELGTLSSVSASFPAGVGWIEVGAQQRSSLSVREACNKIIHAESVTYDFAMADENPLWHGYFVARGLGLGGGPFKAQPRSWTGLAGVGRLGKRGWNLSHS